MKKYFLMIMVFGITCLHAQSQTGTNNLSLFAGKYQSNDNKMTFLTISQKDGQLILKQLWDNQEITFKQTGDLTFYNQDRSFPLAFTKDDKGTITQVLALNRDVWTKVPDNYVPELQKIVQLDASQLKACEGKYQLKGGDGDADDFLRITAAGDHLMLKQLPDKQEVNMWPVAALDFFDDKQTLQITFVKDSKGAVTSFRANHKDTWVKLK
jgi:hypothetical protein